MHSRIGGKAVLRAACGANRIPRAVLRGGHLDGFAVLERRHARAGRVEQIVRALERHKARLPRAPVGGKAADGKRHPSGQAVGNFHARDFARRNGRRARGFVDGIGRWRAGLRKRISAGRNAGKQRHAVRVRLRLIGRAPVFKREARPQAGRGRSPCRRAKGRARPFRSARGRKASARTASTRKGSVSARAYPSGAESWHRYSSAERGSATETGRAVVSITSGRAGSRGSGYATSAPSALLA